MKPTPDKSQIRLDNPEQTVGLMPIRRASNEKPLARVCPDYLANVADVADTLDWTSVYVWDMVSDESCTWLAFTDYEEGHKPDEAIVLCGQIDSSDRTLRVRR